MNTARIRDSPTASLTIGDGVTITNVDQNGGGILRSNVTQIDQFDGKLTTELDATIGSWNLEGGTAHFLQCTVARTFTTLTIGNEGDPRLRHDPAIVSVGTLNAPVQPNDAAFTAAD